MSQALQSYMDDQRGEDTRSRAEQDEQALGMFQPSYQSGSALGYGSPMSLEMKQRSALAGYGDTHVYRSLSEDGLLYGLENAMLAANFGVMASLAATKYATSGKIGAATTGEIGAYPQAGVIQEQVYEHTMETLGFKLQIVAPVIQALLGRTDERDERLVDATWADVQVAQRMPLGLGVEVIPQVGGGWKIKKKHKDFLRVVPVLGSELGPLFKLYDEHGIRRNSTDTAAQLFGVYRSTSYNPREDLEWESEEIIRAVMELLDENNKEVEVDTSRAR